MWCMYVVVCVRPHREPGHRVSFGGLNSKDGIAFQQKLRRSQGPMEGGANDKKIPKREGFSPSGSVGEKLHHEHTDCVLCN